MIKYYLAGPMSGLPQHNVPMFEWAAEYLRDKGYDIVSPAELDGSKFRDIVMQDETGEDTNVGAGKTIEGNTWGDLLARDVKLIADECGGIILLPGWQKSKGARLEAFVALQCGHPAAELIEGLVCKTLPQDIMRQISRGVLA